MNGAKTIRDFHSVSGDTVAAERRPALPLRGEIEIVARRRHQQPKPRRHGNHWRILVWKDVFENGEWTRKRVPEVLGEVGEIGFREAQNRAAAVLEPLNQQPRNPSVAITFGAFVESVYRKIYLPLQSKSHAERYESVLDCHLLPAFGAISLFELAKPISTLAQQYFISLKRRDLGAESLKKIKNCYSSVMATAVEYKYITHNPALGLKLPKAKAARRPRRHITPEQSAAIVELVPEPYATMFVADVASGLIPSELIALRWEDILEDGIIVDEKHCRGEWGAPKTEARRATVPVSKLIIQRIHRLKTLSVRIGGGRGGYQTFKLVKKDGAKDLVFQSVRQGKVMRPDNILARHIKRAARQLGIEGVNWQCLRRSYATWLKRAGVPVRDAQANLRHAKASTTMDIYQQTAHEDQRAAVEKLEAYVGSTMVN